MLNSKISIQNSKINNKGLIANRDIKKGELVWRLDSKEKSYTLEELRNLPPHKAKLAYQYKDRYIIVSDQSEYMNHSCNPNTWWEGDDKLVAREYITKGEEVTYDYATAEIDPRFRHM